MVRGVRGSDEYWATREGERGQRWRSTRQAASTDSGRSEDSGEESGGRDRRPRGGSHRRPVRDEESICRRRGGQGGRTAVASYLDCRLALWCDLTSQTLTKWMRVRGLGRQGLSHMVLPPNARAPIVPSAEFLVTQAFSVFAGLCERHCYCRSFHVIFQLALESGQLPVSGWPGRRESMSVGYVKVGCCPFQWAICVKVKHQFVRVWANLRVPTMGVPSVKVVVMVTVREEIVVLFDVADEYVGLIGYVCLEGGVQKPRARGWGVEWSHEAVSGREETPQMGFVSARGMNAGEWRRRYEALPKEVFRMEQDIAVAVDGNPSWRRANRVRRNDGKVRREVAGFFENAAEGILPGFPQWWPVVISGTDWLDEDVDLAPLPDDQNSTMELWKAEEAFFRTFGGEEFDVPAERFRQVTYPALSKFGVR